MSYLVSEIVEMLISVVLHEKEQQGSIGVAIKPEVNNLVDNLQATKLELVDADRRQWKEPAVKNWLDEFNEICYDLDDVLDEWSIGILKSQSECTPTPKARVCSFSSCSSLLQNEDTLYFGITSRIKDLNKRVDRIMKEKNRFDFRFEKSLKRLERIRTSPSIDNVSAIKGREGDKDTLINMLLSQSSQEPHLHAISIVGLGGIGKTTLAQLIYNDDRIMAHFNKRIWVCVSDPFDEIKIAQAILESLSGSKSNLVELESYLEQICQATSGNRFLLILDDVWEEDSRKWNHLNNSLKCGRPGSKILVTTRKKIVAESLECTYILFLKELSSDDCWSVFSHFAFSEMEDVDRKNLENIGKKIVAKCKGLPLAVKTIGGLLRFKKSKEEWQDVLNKEEWEQDVESGIFYPMLWSYYDIPPKMRQCFLYCAVFPKDYVYEKDELIKLWMAQGYIRQTQSKEMKTIGEECFNNLVARSFFQDFYQNDKDGVIKCKMHDMVHDFAHFITKDQKIVKLEANMLVEKIMESGIKARHLNIDISQGTQFPCALLDLRNLRSLFISRWFLAVEEESKTIANLFNQLTCLRALSLSGLMVGEIPNEIGKLMHLRHLDLSYNVLMELPESICDLYQLYTLDVRHCLMLKRLPKGMGKLTNLKCLNNRGTSCLVPKGIGRLSSLRELDLFGVGYDERGGGCNIGGMKYLNNLLGGLVTEGLGNVRHVHDASEAQLWNKKYLVKLELHFGSGVHEVKRLQDDVVEALRAPPNLEYLGIKFYSGVKMCPSWMPSLTKLRKIYLYDCECENLPPLGKLPALECLEMQYIRGVRRLDGEFLGIETRGLTKSDGGSSSSMVAFPNLKELILRYLRDLEELDVGIEGTIKDEDTIPRITIMPRLLILEIEGCRKLKSLPIQILQRATLMELNIKWCPILEARYNLENGMDWQRILHIPLIRIGNFWFSHTLGRISQSTYERLQQERRI